MHLNNARKVLRRLKNWVSSNNVNPCIPYCSVTYRVESHRMIRRDNIVYIYLSELSNVSKVSKLKSVDLIIL